MTTETLHGVIDGDTIRLSHPSELPTGTQVRIIVMQERLSTNERLPPGEGLKRAFGAWAEYGEDLDRFLEENRQLRAIDRQEPSE